MAKYIPSAYVVKNVNEKARLETTAAEWLNAKIKPQIWGVTMNGASMSVASGLAK